jgi:outer membrane protein
VKRKLSYALLLSLLAPATYADTLGVQAGANYWDYDISGSVRYKTKDSDNDIDVNDDLGYDNDTLTNFYVLFDHPLPAIPNIKISLTDIDTDANGRLSKTVVFGDKTFNVNEKVSSELKLDQIDFTLYYRILDNVANFDLGLNVKYIDAKGTIRGDITGSESNDISAPVPMVYAGVGVDLPFTGLSVSADGSVIGYQDSTFYDYTIRANYTTPWRLGIDVGYRALKLDLDDFDDSFANVKFDGPYAGAYLKF